MNTVTHPHPILITVYFHYISILACRHFNFSNYISYNHPEILNFPIFCFPTPNGYWKKIFLLYNFNSLWFSKFLFLNKIWVLMMRIPLWLSDFYITWNVFFWSLVKIGTVANRQTKRQTKKFKTFWPGELNNQNKLKFKSKNGRKLNNNQEQPIIFLNIVALFLGVKFFSTLLRSYSGKTEVKQFFDLCTKHALKIITADMTVP